MGKQTRVTHRSLPAGCLAPVGTPIFVPVTALAQQAAVTDQKLSLCIFSTQRRHRNERRFHGLCFEGEQRIGGANRPQLSVVSIRLRPSVTLSSLSETAADAPATVTLTCGRTGHGRSDRSGGFLQWLNAASRSRSHFPTP